MLIYMKKFLIIVFIFSIQNIFSQTPPSNLNGDHLKEWLQDNYYIGKHKTLSYKQARVYMYNFIDNVNNNIICVYGGFEKDWNYGGSGSNPDPINCEHTVPQSFFKNSKDSVIMKSDLHHLYPTFKNWNSIRSSYMFGEVDDNTTEKWMIYDKISNKIPNEFIDDYSEYSNGVFEPAENHKGNVARAIFYFYTMYYDKEIKQLSKLADIYTLYQWHLNDPIDEKEIERNHKIEKYQGNRNPYIDYPELIKKAFDL